MRLTTLRLPGRTAAARIDGDRAIDTVQQELLGIVGA